MTDIRTWKGITRNEAYDSDGAYFAQNTRFWIEGEIQRRHGMSAFSATTGGTALISALHPITGRFAVFFNAGTLIAVTA